MPGTLEIKHDLDHRKHHATGFAGLRHKRPEQSRVPYAAVVASAELLLRHYTAGFELHPSITRSCTKSAKANRCVSR